MKYAQVNIFISKYVSKLLQQYMYHIENLYADTTQIHIHARVSVQIS